MLSRRGFLGAAGAAGLLAAAACGSNESGKGPAGAVTVKHQFGETTVPSPPKRVVSAGFTEQDNLLAVGVVPIAVTNWWGDQPFAVWPWAQPKLGAAQPVVLSLTDGLQFDQIATLKPDLIVATNAGLDQDGYKRLSAIAPTIAQTSGQPPFFEPWKAQANAIGQAVFQADQMRSLVAQIDNRFTELGKTNPQFGGKKVLILQGTFYQDNVIATRKGWRTEFLNQMGIDVPDTIDAFKVDDRAFLPRDQAVEALDAADALIWKTESDDEEKRLVADPMFQRLKATKQNRNLFTGKDLSGAIAFSSPLSLPVVADQLTPMLSKVLS
ncbi:ABC transporter substrate-binding protein [Mycobacterium sp.]|uniref:ABC transporter substrate-binding protein n=1 Tax=Mycobacterium sp. TaxID=1785 RepID=UPI002D32B16E|nr:ABC transporter substrate-binding protein [Mycobacterium sp.]HZA09273.1 ABC transporter substrate-binding protein [Mycobacterium sp.]